MVTSSGAHCQSELEHQIPGSRKIPDIDVIDASGGGKDTFGDVRTVTVTLRDRCKINSRNPGAPSEHGASLKHSSWDQHLVCLNTRIIPLCHEDGGRIGQEALSFIDSISSAAGFSQAERLPWTIFWKQRLHITSTKGVARVLRGPAPFRASPHIVRHGTQTIGTLPPRPIGIPEPPRQRDTDQTVRHIPQWVTEAADRFTPVPAPGAGIAPDYRTAPARTQQFPAPAP